MFMDTFGHKGFNIGYEHARNAFQNCFTPARFQNVKQSSCSLCPV